MSCGGGGLSCPLGRCLSWPLGFLLGVKPSLWGCSSAMPMYAKSPSPDTPSGKRSIKPLFLSSVMSLVGPRTLSCTSTISPLLRSTPTCALIVCRFFLPLYQLSASFCLCSRSCGEGAERTCGRCTACSKVSITTPSSGNSESKSESSRRCLRPGSGILIPSLPAWASIGTIRLTSLDTTLSDTPNKKPSTSLVGYLRSHTTASSTWSRIPNLGWQPPPTARCLGTYLPMRVTERRCL